MRVQVGRNPGIENIHETVQVLEPLIQSFQKREKFDVLLDFSLVESITPSPIAILAAVLLFGYRRQSIGKAGLKESGRKAINDYLERMDFYSLLKSPDTWSAPKQIGRRELIEVKNEKMALKITGDLIAVLGSQVTLSQDNGDSISYVLSELLDNVFHHAQSPVNAIVCADADEKRKVVEIAIVDCGIGFRKSLAANEAVGKKIKNSKQALELAVQLKVTGRPDHNTGQGLFFIMELIKENKGRAAIHSDDAELQIQQGKQLSLKGPFWQGSIVSVRLNLKNPIDLVSIFNRLAPPDRDFDFI